MTTAAVPAASEAAQRIARMLKEAEEHSALGERARETLHRHIDAGHWGEAWIYEELAESCEETSSKLLTEARNLYQAADIPVQRQAVALACGCRYARCLC